MNAKGEGTEPLLGIAGTWQSLRATGTDWRHHARHLEAFERASVPPSGIGVTTVTARFESAAAKPSESLHPWLLWIEKPELKRAEFVVGEELWTVAFRGDRWWSWSPSRGALSNEERPNHHHGAGPSDALLTADRLPGALHMEEVSRGRVLGRDVVHLRGAPRSVRTADDFRLVNALHPFGRGGDEYLFTLDAEQGVLLRSEARMAGEACRIIEVVEIAFDVSFAVDAFAPPLDRR
jgi:hypothetical protein